MRYLFFLLMWWPLYMMAQPATYDEYVDVVVDSLVRRSRSFSNQHNLDSALVFAAQATQMAADCCGNHSLSYASACFNEGRARHLGNKFNESIPWYRVSIEIRRKHLPAMHYDLSKSLNNLAIVYDLLKRYEEAEPLYKEALQIRLHANKGGKDLRYADALDNLAGMYRNMGRYEDAETMGNEAMDIRAREAGKNSEAYAISLINRGNLYLSLNDVQSALTFHEQAMQIMQNIGKDSTQRYITLLNNTAVDLQELGQYKEAKVMFEKAAAMHASLVGSADIGYWDMQCNILLMDYCQGEYAAAALQMEGLLQDMITRPNDYWLHKGIGSQYLAMIYTKQKRYEEAYRLCEQALHYFEGRLVVYHDKYRFLLRQLYTLGKVLNHETQAYAYLQQLRDSEEQWLSLSHGFMTEVQLSRIVEDVMNSQHLYLSHAMDQPSVVGDCFDDALKYKGLLLASTRELKELVTKDTSLLVTFNTLKASKRHLAAQYTLPIDEQSGVAELEATVAGLEELVKATADETTFWEMPNWQSMQAHLSQDEAAVEFVFFEPTDLKSDKEEIYAALVLLWEVICP
ncbi:MAG: tetratricopeptide repeat protein [Saprospiraceae bacterium]